MSKQFQSVRGMNDKLPTDIGIWHHVEKALRETALNYGYEEIRTPVVEVTELFKRSLGEVTDVVEKEMYTFVDRDNVSLSLRPEGTAGCVRAGLEHGLLYNQVQRLWYMGSMYRHERPQKGRFREFFQFGIEAFGLQSVWLDVELLLFAQRVFKRLGVLQHVHLEINSLGDKNARDKHREALVSYFNEHLDELDQDSKRRLTLNPLRILDSKNPDMQDLNNAAPKLLDYLSEEDKNYFDDLLHLLDKVGIKYTINTRLVRGLDYYCSTVFEWVTDALGSQGAVCAGGHYDGLVTELGGQQTPAAGFAIGMGRLVELVKISKECEYKVVPHAYMVIVGDKARKEAAVLAEDIRDSVPGLRMIVDTEDGKFAKQLKRADKSGALLALILGDHEIDDSLVTIKDLRSDEKQREVNWSDLPEFLRIAISKL